MEAASGRAVPTWMAFRRAVSLCLDRLGLFNSGRTHLHHCPHVRFKIIKAIDYFITSRVGYPVSFVVCVRQTRIANDSRDVDKSTLRNRIGDKVLRMVNMLTSINETCLPCPFHNTAK